MIKIIFEILYFNLWVHKDKTITEYSQINILMIDNTYKVESDKRKIKKLYGLILKLKIIPLEWWNYQEHIIKFYN